MTSVVKDSHGGLPKVLVVNTATGNHVSRHYLAGYVRGGRRAVAHFRTVPEFAVSSCAVRWLNLLSVAS